MIPAAGRPARAGPAKLSSPMRSAPDSLLRHARHRAPLAAWALASLLAATGPAQDRPAPGSWRPLDATLAHADLEELLESARAAAGLSRAEPADARTLARRAALVLTGLPPAAARDGHADFARMVDDLLASRAHAERQTQHWLDLVRYADTHGFETNTPRPNAWRYRDWLVDAFHRDLPYDRFVTAQLAGDRIGEDAATGFLVAGPWDEVKSPDPRLTAEQRSNELADMVGVTGETFLGLTLGCARCHDHKFDPITQRDFFAVEAVFAGVQHGERELQPTDDEGRSTRIRELEAQRRELRAERARHEPLAAPDHPRAAETPAPTRSAVRAGGNVDRIAACTATAVRFTVEETLGGIEPCIDELEVFEVGTGRNVALQSHGAVATASSEYPGNPIHKIHHANDGLFGNAHSWIPAERNQAWLQIDFAEEATIDRIEWARDVEGRYADRLATRYRIEARTPEGEWHVVASSSDRLPYGTAVSADEPSNEAAALSAALAELDAELAALRTLPRAYAGRFVTPPATHRLHRGDATQPREVVAPGAVTALAPLELAGDAPGPERRLALAHWLTHEAQALLARVVVNRIWQQHFGSGLVITPNDFGRAGAAPSHPAVLDALAAGLIAEGWSLRAVHRRILATATWQQASDPSPEALRLDAQNRLLSWFPSRRLDAESIRDAMLTATGELVLDGAGGPGFDVFEPNSNYVRVYTPRTTFGPEQLRRAVYTRRIRMERDPTFGVFDCPDAARPVPQRGRSTTALQAFSLLNSPFVIGRSSALATRLMREAPEDRGDRIRRAFELVLQRRPDETEQRAASELVEHHGLPALCRALFNTSEFLFLP